MPALARFLRPACRPRTLWPPPSGMFPSFFDVDVYEVAEGGVLVAADHPAGGPVQVGQACEPVAGQDTVHGCGVQPKEVGDTGRSPPSQDADLDDPTLGAASTSGQLACFTGAYPSIMWRCQSSGQTAAPAPRTTGVRRVLQLPPAPPGHHQRPTAVTAAGADHRSEADNPASTNDDANDSTASSTNTNAPRDLGR
jgi:hypothetical protein